MVKVPKGYTIGVSSGLWSIEKKEGMLGIARKIEWIATSAGTIFTEVALDSMTEFTEPDLKKKVEKAVSLGMIFGMHSESYATGGLDSMPLASALESDYVRAHDRLLQHIEGAGKIGAIYINSHTTESSPFILLDKELEIPKLVDWWGRKFDGIIDENPDIADWLLKMDYTKTYLNFRHDSKEEYEEAVYDSMVKSYPLTHEGKYPEGKAIAELKKEAKKTAEKNLRSLIKDSFYGTHHSYGVEKLAYFCIAKWMMKHKDPLWQKIVGHSISDEDLPKPETTLKWVPAVAAKYIWGHFMQNDNPDQRDYKDPRTLLEKYKLYWSFETPMTRSGYEGYMRLSQLPHIYSLITSINSDWIRFTVDMEHILGNNLDPEKQIKAMPRNAAEKLLVVHLTVPHPLNPSHMPLQMASEAQYYIYKRLFQLREKGFENGFFLFEIGKEGAKESVLVMRLMKEYLEKGILPNDLPPEFFGIPPQGPDYERQLNVIKEHMFDPVKGLLTVPEEEYTFLSKVVAEKGKAEIWKKEQYK